MLCKFQTALNNDKRIQEKENDERSAKKHIPAIVEDLVRLTIHDEQTNINDKEMLDNVSYCEDAKDYFQVVEINLEISENHYDNLDKFEEIWL